ACTGSSRSWHRLAADGRPPLSRVADIPAKPAACPRKKEGPGGCPGTSVACAAGLPDLELAGLHHAAVQRDFDLVLAGRPAVRLADLEVGHAVTGEGDVPGFLVHGLAAVHVGPLHP